MTIREFPILFSAPMLRAILDGRKTQMRPVMPLLLAPGGWKPETIGPGYFNVGRAGDLVPTQDMVCLRHAARGTIIPAPWQVGDRLWVREGWRVSSTHDDWSPCAIPAGVDVEYLADPGGILTGRGRPSSYMPRWASRITLEVTAVRVERLQDISEADARAEGDDDIGPCDHSRQSCADIGCCGPGFKGGFCVRWQAKHGAELWDFNPWVAATTFRMVQL